MKLYEKLQLDLPNYFPLDSKQDCYTAVNA